MLLLLLWAILNPQLARYSVRRYKCVLFAAGPSVQLAHTASKLMEIRSAERYTPQLFANSRALPRCSRSRESTNPHCALTYRQVACAGCMAASSQLPHPASCTGRDRGIIKSVVFPPDRLRPAADFFRYFFYLHPKHYRWSRGSACNAVQSTRKALAESGQTECAFSCFFSADSDQLNRTVTWQ